MTAVIESNEVNLSVKSSHAPRPNVTSIAKTAVASLSGISKRYANGVVALDGLSLQLYPGEIVALLGPNGAGKSTAVRLMLGLSSPTSGSVSIFGADPRHAAARLRTGTMLQVGRAPEMLRVREHITIFRGYYPQPMAYAELVAAAGLNGIEERMFGELSGGQKQRVLFALALAGDPDLIFLDEPTVGLDIEARRLMWAQIRSLATRGKTVLLTTHYLEEADALAHRIVVINKGKVACSGTPAEVKSIAAGVPLEPLGANTDGSPYAALTARAGIKIIRCATSLPETTLRAMPGVTHIDAAGNSTASLTIITTTAPEQTLREMLALDSSLHSLEVASPALEDAFLALTSDRN